MCSQVAELTSHIFAATVATYPCGEVILAGGHLARWARTGSGGGVVELELALDAWAPWPYLLRDGTEPALACPCCCGWADTLYADGDWFLCARCADVVPARTDLRRRARRGLVIEEPERLGKGGLTPTLLDALVPDGPEIRERRRERARRRQLGEVVVRR